VRLLECLDANTGERIWSRLMLDAERLVGAAGPRLIYQTGRGLVALDKQTGEPRWLHEAEKLMVGMACDEHVDRLGHWRDAFRGEFTGVGGGGPRARPVRHRRGANLGLRGPAADRPDS
jgi:hypothetical protein